MHSATRYGLAAARLAAFLVRPMVWFTARQALGGKMIERLSKSMSASDTEVLKREDVRESLGASLAESFRQGNGPATWDGVGSREAKASARRDRAGSSHLARRAGPQRSRRDGESPGVAAAARQGGLLRR
jgi:hypothetical protein